MVAAAIVGGAVVGAAGSAYAGNKASKAQQSSAAMSVDEQRRQFDLTQERTQPWIDAGTNALNRLQNPGDYFTAAPDYGFVRSEAMRGIQQTAAARGGLKSGNALLALQDRAAQLGNQYYGDWWNRQAGLAGVGQTATNQLNAYGQQTAGNIGNTLMASGDARASGILSSYSNAANSINSGLSNYLLYRGGYFTKPGG